MTNIKGMIFDIQRFSVHDGPGIRTTAFMKGCPLKCRWCHNPEGLYSKPQLQFIDEKCILCHNCTNVCENHSIFGNTHTVDFTKCHNCGKCVGVCPSKALLTIGRSITVDKLIKEALKDRDFYDDEGGITFSGGEATLQIEFLSEALKQCKANELNTAVDTSGFAPWESYTKIIPYTDIFLYDIKAVSEDIHINGTGVSNKIILENIKKLTGRNCRVWVRIPVVPGFNATIEEMTKIADFLSGINGIEQIELMPYHKLGRNKYYNIGYEYPFESTPAVSQDDMQSFMQLFVKRKLNVV